MKEDELKKFVNEHREAFDDREVPAGMWDTIEGKLSQDLSAQKRLTEPVDLIAKRETRQRRMIPKKWLSIAAGLLLLVGAIGIAYQQGVKSGTQISAVQVNPEFLEIEKHYERTISDKLAVLVAVHHDENILEDLDDMSVYMEELKIELQPEPFC